MRPLAGARVESRNPVASASNGASCRRAFALPPRATAVRNVAPSTLSESSSALS